MSLTSSLFTGTSGLKNLGNAMQVIGDNIANVNTVGFKRNGYTFSDVLSQSVATQSGTAQVGRGMAIGNISSTFEQGSFESTGNTTDLSIGGDGFFVVQDPNSDNNFYTRAGNFQFDKNGYLVNPEGYVVQGWELDSESGEEIGSVTDILLNSFTSPPVETDQVTMITNLDAEALSQTEVLSNVWDGMESPAIDSSNFEYQSVVTVYDSLGSTHDITTYFDKKSDNEWEYMVTCNPEEDNRNLVQGTSSAGLLARGMITFSENGSISDMTMSTLSGIVGQVGGSFAENAAVTVNSKDSISSDDHASITIDAAGGVTPSLPNYPAATATLSSSPKQIQIHLNGTGETDITIDLDDTTVFPGNLTFDINSPASSLHVQDLENIVYDPPTIQEDATMTINNPAALTEDIAGITLTWDDTSTPPWSSSDSTNVSVSGDENKALISLLGSGETDITFEFENSLSNGNKITFDIVGTTAWNDVDTNDSGLFEFTADFLGGDAGSTFMDIEFDIGAHRGDSNSFVNESLSTTQYSRSSSTTFQSGNGYGAGDLQGVDVASDGVITGTYSNGELIPLYRVSLAKFQNNQGLFKAGGNLYRETRDSGTAITNKPGENGLGSLSPNSLEMSNVDISDEFVKMISTQRGFQANSKIVTTVDDMLSDVIAMKR